MKPPHEVANIDIHADVQALLGAWCDRRSYQAICTLYGGYRSINGLTDGWGEFLKALQLVRNLARQEKSGISEEEAAKVQQMIGVVSRTLNC
jgi:hypothetical protein